MKIIYTTLILFVLMFTGMGCEDNQHHEHGEQMHGNDQEMHRDPQGMTDMYGMEDHMHDLQLRSGQMMQDWQYHMGETTQTDTVYGHSMMNMSRQMHDMAEDMFGIMNHMNSLMNNEEMMRNKAYKNHLKQMQEHMNQMMKDYEGMLDQLHEMNDNQE